ncbi:MAG TPA: hypothetical protein PKN15_01315, partial [Chitinophagales bacterium]|nr:hypothetical protein [Chitinophagales bacterium]
ALCELGSHPLPLRAKNHPLSFFLSPLSFLLSPLLKITPLYLGFLYLCRNLDFGYYEYPND